MQTAVNDWSGSLNKFSEIINSSGKVGEILHKCFTFLFENFILKYLLTF